jgi:hypothetical protein
VTIDDAKKLKAQVNEEVKAALQKLEDAGLRVDGVHIEAIQEYGKPRKLIAVAVQVML